MSDFAIGLNAAINGYRDAEDRADRKERQDRAEARAIGDQEYRRQVDAENREFRQKSFDATQDYRKQQLAIGESQQKFNNSLAQENLKLRKQGEARTAELQTMQIKNAKKDQLKTQALQEWQLMEKTGRPFSKETHDALLESGMVAFSPYSWQDEQFVQDNLALGPLLESVKSGDLNAINKPENLAVLSKIYKDQLQKGIGEAKAPLRTKIVDKELAGFRTIRDQHNNIKVVPMIKSILEDGSEYEAPITLNRSTDPKDPVEAKDATMFLDDAMGRYQMALMAQNKDAMAGINKAAATIFGIKQPEQKPVSSQGKLYQDLVKMGGFSEADAKKMAFESKNDKAEFIRKYMLGRLANVMPGKNGPTAADFMEEAEETYSKIYPDDPEPEPIHGTGSEVQNTDAIEKILAANPGKSKEWAAAYAEHLGKI